MSSRAWSLLLPACSFAAALGGCTVLGPMPATTGMIGTAAERPDVEAQIGVIPGYYLSEATHEAPNPLPINQAAGMIEPGRLIGVPGLGVGARYIGGGDEDGYFEPMLRYRGALDDDHRFTGVGVAYGTRASGSHDDADYTATRGGLELGADARLTPVSRWFELHALASASVTGLDAKGHYCLDAQGLYGTDCGDEGVPKAAAASGFYPAATLGLAGELGKHLDSIFHGGRLAMMWSGGMQPRLEGGEQRSARYFTAGGISLTLGVGAL